MLDFKNGSFVKLKDVGAQVYAKDIQPLLVDGEHVISGFKAMRDSVVFTNKRIIAINVQGITGSKADYTSLPYSKIQAYSVETASVWEMVPDAEMELWFSGLGKVRFEFNKGADIIALSKVISQYVL